MFGGHSLDHIILRHSHFTRRLNVMELKEDPDQIPVLRGTSTGGTGPDLTGYAKLCYAPLEYGEGIRVASNGASVDEIAHDVGIDVMASLDDLATEHGVSLDELLDAIRYARANGSI